MAQNQLVVNLLKRFKKNELTTEMVNKKAKDPAALQKLYNNAYDQMKKISEEAIQKLAEELSQDKVVLEGKIATFEVCNAKMSLAEMKGTPRQLEDLFRLARKKAVVAISVQNTQGELFPEHEGEEKDPEKQEKKEPGQAEEPAGEEGEETII